MLYGAVIVVHVISCLVLILTILMQAGKGGGLSEAFGMGSAQSLFGTKTNVFLTKATTVCAILFLSTCLALGILTSRRGRSLVALQKGLPTRQSAALDKTVNDVSNEIETATESSTNPEPLNAAKQ